MPAGALLSWVLVAAAHLRPASVFAAVRAVAPHGTREDLRLLSRLGVEAAYIFELEGDGVHAALFARDDGALVHVVQDRTRMTAAHWVACRRIVFDDALRGGLTVGAASVGRCLLRDVHDTTTTRTHARE
jgi:hypothetical protein